ncbi:MAG: hypothetical protein K5894_01315 [Lachnospiraceae bacterium]|nr:hypothetical protein [Lachnospiraceae bacterium]
MIFMPDMKNLSKKKTFRCPKCKKIYKISGLEAQADDIRCSKCGENLIPLDPDFRKY